MKLPTYSAVSFFMLAMCFSLGLLFACHLAAMAASEGRISIRLPLNN